MLEKKSGYLKITVNPKIYPLPAVYGAAYVFIDKVYVYLDGHPEKKIEIYFKAKEGIGEKGLQEIIGQFENEMLNYALREQIVKSNQKIREQIIAQALLSPLYTISELAKKAQDESYLADPLGIAQTWEERFGKKSKKQNARKNENHKT